MQRFAELYRPGYAAVMMTPSECRAARALLEWSQMQLAEASVADVAAIRDFEACRLPPADANVAALKGTLQNASVEFISEIGGGVGVRLRKSQ